MYLFIALGSFSVVQVFKGIFLFGLFVCQNSKSKFSLIYRGFFNHSNFNFEFLNGYETAVWN